jgi:hypothetical protein
MTSPGYATQDMIGSANPFSPPKGFHAGQQDLAIILRFVGWILVPATVGATAGLIAKESRFRSFNQPENTLAGEPPKSSGSTQP